MYYKCMKRPVLIIIPGLGDRGWLYRIVVPLWHILGFDVKVFVFGWNSHSPSRKVKMKRLLAYIDTAIEPVYIIGVSAGGVAAVNALYSRPHKIRQLVTVATPYKAVPSLKNAILSALQKEAGICIERDPALIAACTTSFYGLYDKKVPIERSRVAGLREVQLPLVGHGAIILCALTLYCMRLKKIVLGRTNVS